MRHHLILGSAAVLCLGVSACAEVKPGNHYTVYLDPAFSADELSEIVGGLADWTTHVPVTFDVVVTTCSGFVSGVICTHRAATTADLPGGNSNDLLGETYTVRGREGTRGDTGGWSLEPLPESGVDGGEMWIDMSQVATAVAAYPTVLSAVFNHELGHAQGLIHHYSPVVALMNPYLVGGSTTVTCDDVSQWWYVRFQTAPGCGVEDAGTDAAGE
jgi:hypothetical protein